MYVLVDVVSDCGAPVLQSGPVIDDIGGSLASGILGESVVQIDNVLQWTLPGVHSVNGTILKVLRPTGDYHDYAGIGILFRARKNSRKGCPHILGGSYRHH